MSYANSKNVMLIKKKHFVGGEYIKFIQVSAPTAFIYIYIGSRLGLSVKCRSYTHSFSLHKKMNVLPIYILLHETSKLETKFVVLANYGCTLTILVKECELLKYVWEAIYVYKYQPPFKTISEYCTFSVLTKSFCYLQSLPLHLRSLR